MTDCLACDVLEGGIRPPGGVIYEDELWVVDHSISPVRLRGWLIVKPRRHVEDFADLSAAEAASFGPLASVAARAVRDTLGAGRVYVCSFGEEWRHVHVHVVPRYPGMEPVSWELLGLMWSDRSPWGCDDREAEAAAEAVRQAWP
jgi:diadenosine tetraphosphate (Ap4A) HIT family hydrolase